jgi:hypothetical protein
MKEITGDLFKQTWAEAICITTNGFVKKNGEAVMGRGCAKAATTKFPTIASELGKNLMTVGNLPAELLSTKDYTIFSFPVKKGNGLCAPDKDNVVEHMQSRFKPYDSVPGWALKADKELIMHSAQLMMDWADRLNLKSIIIPRPGCGAGELTWDDIRPGLEKILDDRFHSITFN